MKPTSLLPVTAALIITFSAMRSGFCEDAKDLKPLALVSSHTEVWIPIAFPIEGKNPMLQRILRTSAELDDALSRPAVKDEDRKSLLKSLGREKIDWEQEMIIAIHGGTTPRGYRHRVKIESIKSREKSLVVTYEVVKTDHLIVGWDGGTVVIIVPRFDGHVRFVNVSK